MRVIRRRDGAYEYGGLYQVEAAYDEAGLQGFRICRYRLRKLDALPGRPEVGPPAQSSIRRRVTTYRLARDGTVAARVKSWHRFLCQVCGVRVETAEGGYAEAAHIVPLGDGFAGPDVVENVLCLCPNHHAALDHGGIYFSDDLHVYSPAGTVIGTLNDHPLHRVDPAYVAAHRRRFGR